MHFLPIVVLALVQGFTELLPVSSSAHVIVAEKLMGLDPSSPEMTLLLVMLHTGTMLSVLVYFWKDWKGHYFKTREAAVEFLKQAVVATAATGFLGLLLKFLIEKVYLKGSDHAEVESLFGDLRLVSFSLACAGALILLAANRGKAKTAPQKLGIMESLWVGLVQGVCLPFRGFSRSGATISTGMLLGIAKDKAEEFSFALAVILTPAVLAQEVHRLLKAQALAGIPGGGAAGLFLPGLLGMFFSFLAGLLALWWLSSWLAKGRWGWFGVYCLLASALVWFLA